MTVYVETNFLLCLVFREQEAAACAAILHLARRGLVRLAIPAFCLVEPAGTLVRRDAQRSRIVQETQRLHLEIARGSGRRRADLTVQRHRLVAALDKIGKDEARRLRRCRERTVACAQVIGAGGEVAAAALGLEGRLGLSPPDALVFACVLADLAAAPRDGGVFVSQDVNAFGTPDVRAALAADGCRWVNSFRAVASMLAAENDKA